MKNWTKKFLLALCLVLLCAFTMAYAEDAASSGDSAGDSAGVEAPAEDATAEEVPAEEVPAEPVDNTIVVEMPTEDGEVVLQPALDAKIALNGNVTICLEQNAEGAWYICDVVMNDVAGEAAEVEVPVADLVTVVAVVDGKETVVTPAMTLVAHNEEGHSCVDATVNAEDVAAAMGEKYSVGDLKATTITFTTVEGKTTAKVAFHILAPVWIYYIDGVEGEEIFPSFKLSAKIGDPTPKFPLGADPVREGYEFDGWGYVRPYVTGQDVHTAKWLKYCTITYTNGYDGTVLAEYVVLEGQPTPAFDGETPVREGFEFNGFGSVDAVVSDDVTYEAQWLEYFTVTYFDWYDQKVLEEFVVLEGQPTPTIDPNRYTKASYVNMGFTTEIAPTVTGDVTYTMIQMVPPRENNVSGLSLVCTCVCNGTKHTKTIGYSSTAANYLRNDDISENVYFDGENYKCTVYLLDDMTDFVSFYNGKVSTKVKNSHTYLGRTASSFTVTYDMDAKRWYADQSSIEFLFECPTTPVVTATTYSKTRIRVKGIVNGTTKTKGSMYLDAANVYVGPITGNAVDGWTVQVTVTNYEPYIAQWEALHGVEAVVDTETTGTLVYTFTYTMPSDGLIRTDGSGWTFLYPSTDVKNNGYTIWVTPVEATEETPVE